MTQRYVLGIDAGGTGTRAVLATLDGEAIAIGQGGAANIHAQGADVTRRALQAAVDAALSAVPGLRREGIAAVAAGMAGLHVPADRDQLRAMVQAMLPASAVVVRNDGEIALIGGTGGRPGIAVVAGTGSIAYGSDASGRFWRCGGWGYLIGDEGSAYAIAQQALRLASHARDGRGRSTALVDVLAAALGVSDFDDIVHPVYGPPPLSRPALAALAPLVARCAAEGDGVACAIIAQAGTDLAAMAITLARQLYSPDRPFPVVCTGSVWRAGETLTGAFRERLGAAYPRAQPGPPLLAPVGGAVLLAIQSFSREIVPRRDVVAALRKTLEPLLARAGGADE